MVQAPRMLTHPNWTDAPNGNVHLYEGKIRVGRTGGSGVAIDLDGEIRFEMLPSPRVVYEGGADGTGILEAALRDLTDPPTTWVQDIVVLPDLTSLPSAGGETSTAPSHDHSGPTSWTYRRRGVVSGLQVGQGSMARLAFVLVNGQEIRGSPLRDASRWWRGRVVLQASGWHVTLDSRPDLDAALDNRNKLTQELADLRGFAMTHVGSLVREDGSGFTVDEATSCLKALRTCLSLAAGRWVSPTLPIGYDEDLQPVWVDWGPWITDPWRSGVTRGFLDPHRPPDLQSAFELVLNIWSDADPYRRKVFERGLYYLITANVPDPFEMAVVGSQSGLELLAFALLVEERKRYSEDELKALSAGQRIVELLKECGIQPDIPASLAELTRAAHQGPPEWRASDAPGQIAGMRNTVTHPKHTGRSWGMETWFEAWQLTQTYLELAILHQLGYEGRYFERSAWQNKPVPWARSP